jgi:hypothetical protein
MPDLDRLVSRLAALAPPGDDSLAARDVAARLVEGVLRERWQLTPQSRREALTRDSANRLWAGYISRLAFKDNACAEAAYEAIQEELAVLRNYG